MHSKKQSKVLAIDIFKQIKFSKNVEIFYFEYYNFKIDSKEFFLVGSKNYFWYYRHKKRHNDMQLYNGIQRHFRAIALSKKIWECEQELISRHTEKKNKLDEVIKKKKEIRIIIPESNWNNFFFLDL